MVLGDGQSEKAGAGVVGEQGPERWPFRRISRIVNRHKVLPNNWLRFFGYSPGSATSRPQQLEGSSCRTRIWRGPFSRDQKGPGLVRDQEVAGSNPVTPTL